MCLLVKVKRVSLWNLANEALRDKDAVYPQHTKRVIEDVVHLVYLQRFILVNTGLQLFMHSTCHNLLAIEVMPMQKVNACDVQVVSNSFFKPSGDIPSPRRRPYRLT